MTEKDEPKNLPDNSLKRPSENLTGQDAQEYESALVFPTRFPIKVMVKSIVGIEKTILGLIQSQAPDATEKDLRTRESREKRFMSVTVTINATSQAQLDAIYQSLTDHPDVLMSF